MKSMREVDVLVLGAGFSGLYAIYQFRKLGFSVEAIERGPDVGGVWYWNTYPGARCDAESVMYSYSFSEELEQEWKWPERFSAQPAILSYAHHVADRFDLRRHITFGTELTQAHWDEGRGRWLIHTDTGEHIAAKYFIASAGSLSAGRVPEFTGLADFKGEWNHTGAWPHEKVNFAGQRVAVIGTGSSGVQAIPVIAKEAAHLTVFQRTANYCVPAKNHPLDDSYDREIKASYTQHRQEARLTGLGFNIPMPPLSTEVTPEERQAEFERRWEAGGPFFMFAFLDMMVNKAINDEAAEFIRKKIRETVKDPQTAELLCPKDYPLGAKRICVGNDYFEAYNEPNVVLVDVQADPIERFTPDGLVLRSGKFYALDRVVFATGYDAMTGPLLRMDIRGRDGMPLSTKWAAGPQTYLGLATEGFPNMFIPTGPGNPSAVSNFFVAIEEHINFIAGIVTAMREQGFDIIDVDPAFERDWVEHVNVMANATLWPQADSWYLGANIPGKPRVFMPYVGGVGAYREKCAAVAADGYSGFILSQTTPKVQLRETSDA